DFKVPSPFMKPLASPPRRPGSDAAGRLPSDTYTRSLFPRSPRGWDKRSALLATRCCQGGEQRRRGPARPCSPRAHLGRPRSVWRLPKTRLLLSRRPAEAAGCRFGALVEVRGGPSLSGCLWGGRCGLDGFVCRRLDGDAGDVAVEPAREVP